MDHATFLLREPLPSNILDGREAGPEVSESPLPNQRFKVLVVEDDEEMNALQREFLEVHGLETFPAYDGCQALEACELEPIDAVLLDVMLPKKDGFETCRLLRLRAGKELPIVMLTALEGEEFFRRGTEAGANAYFTKPFDPVEVVEKILELLAQDSID